MKTLNIAISDVEYTKFGITGNVLSFSDFVDMISKELMKKNMETSVAAAEKYGLSSMTMEDKKVPHLTMAQIEEWTKAPEIQSLVGALKSAALPPDISISDIREERLAAKYKI